MAEKNDSIDIKECAKRLRVSIDTVRRRVKKGKLRYHRAGERALRFIWAEVVEDTEEREGPQWTL